MESTEVVKMIPPDEVFLELVEDAADWRRQKLLEYPDDERNAQSAKALEYLSQFLKRSAGDTSIEFWRLTEQIFKNPDSSFAYVQEISERKILIQFGFHHFPDDLQQRDIVCLALLDELSAVMKKLRSNVA